jgi:putative phage-type endonuclease
VPALTPANDLVRARNVSASECYALLGKHPYSSPQKIFDRLTSPAIEVRSDQTQAMAIGSYLEPYVARFAAKKLGIKVRAATRTVEHRTVPLCATPDYIVIKQPMLLEVKVSSITYGWTEDTLHPHYEYQARAQLACTGRDVCIVAALVGSALYTIPVVRDMEKEERLLEAVRKFWDDHILTGIRPPTVDARLSVATVTER